MSKQSPGLHLGSRRRSATGAVLPLLGCMVLVSACMQGSDMTPADLNQAYETALAETAAPVATVFSADSPAEQAALERLQTYFIAMTAASVSELTAEVYGPDAWLYDNLTAIQGLDNIRQYFGKAVTEADSLSVDFLQIARSNEDYFIRWRMQIVSARLADGKPMVSYGMSQFRFDAQGRVVLHRDFWDAGTGLYEYLPVLGSVVGQVRQVLADFSSD